MRAHLNDRIFDPPAGAGTFALADFTRDVLLRAQAMAAPGIPLYVYREYDNTMRVSEYFYPMRRLLRVVEAEV